MQIDSYTISETYLDVGQGHSLYIQEWGNPKSTETIIYLHGGPGAGCSDRHRMIFDPNLQRVIFFDQRGCGKSLPLGSLEHNTTKNLVEDIEKIIVHFKLKTVILTGSSWGSCLAFCFALKFPARVDAMVLRGIWTGSQAENSWLNEGRWSVFFPEVWDRYLDATPVKYQNNPSDYHIKTALGSDEAKAKSSAYAYSLVEASLLSLDDRFVVPKYEDFDPSGTKIELHYLAHNVFLPDRHIINNAHKLTMPVWLVQGRYDFVCPPVTAYELAHKLPHCRLINTVAGHGNDRSNYDIVKMVLGDIASGK